MRRTAGQRIVVGANGTLGPSLDERRLAERRRRRWLLHSAGSNDPNIIAAITGRKLAAQHRDMRARNHSRRVSPAGSSSNTPPSSRGETQPTGTRRLLRLAPFARAQWPLPRALSIQLLAPFFSLRFADDGYWSHRVLKSTDREITSFRYHLIFPERLGALSSPPDYRLCNT